MEVMGIMSHVSTSSHSPLHWQADQHDHYTKDDWMKRFAAQLDKIAPEEYNVNEVALQQANAEAEWWNTEDAEAWSDPEMVAELYDFNLQWQKMRESESE